MNIEVNASDAEILVSLTGEATVEDAASIADEFRRLAADGKPLLTFDLSGVTEIDITFMQLLYALSNTLSGAGRHLMLFSLPPDHPVMRRSALTGMRIDHHFTIAEKKG